MKIAISVPDEIFQEAERLARKTNISRSKLYSLALKEYLARHSDDDVTEGWNRVIDEVGEGSDPFMREATRRTLKRSEWEE